MEVMSGDLPHQSSAMYFIIQKSEYTIFYKQDFYKQHQAEIGKKLSKS